MQMSDSPIEKAIWGQSREQFEDTGFEDWSDVRTNQGMMATTRNWKRQGMNSPLEPLEREWPFSLKVDIMISVQE